MSTEISDLRVAIRLGRLFKRKREELGVSLREIAPRVGLSASKLSRLENGQIVHPSLQDVWKLQDFFGLSEKDLREVTVMNTLPPVKSESRQYLQKCEIFAHNASPQDLLYADAFLDALLRYLRDERERELLTIPSEDE